jgi:hypothetical protein
MSVEEIRTGCEPTSRQWLADWAEAGFPDPVTEPQSRALVETLIDRVEIRPLVNRGANRVIASERATIAWR